MPEARPSTPAQAVWRPLPLRQRALRTVGWAAFVGGGLLTPRLAGKAAARLWCKLPDGAARRKDNRPWKGRFDMVDIGLTSPIAVETWEPGSAPAAPGEPAGTVAEAGPGRTASGNYADKPAGTVAEAGPDGTASGTYAGEPAGTVAEAGPDG
ncbi:MAG: hypothetical protein LBD90_03765, partial [Bifidobacteriaceae bacterium]|nr:hypothetical protein [Bifidobacteriaceae bacterium]